jgi:putative tryptophan/tyrosine transport system substrate-binding protein
MAIDISRRQFMSALGGAAVAWPLAARAQQPAVPLIGFMNTLSPEVAPHFMSAFRQGLKEQGFVEGQNVAVDYRWAYGHYDRLPEFAADLVRRQVAVIAATGGQPSPRFAMAATQTIPIVFTTNGDPVREGLVASLNRPGGNVTGFTIFGGGAVAKRLQLLHEFVPKIAVLGFLMNPTNPSANFELNAAQEAAHSFGMDMQVIGVSNDTELKAVFASLQQRSFDALLVASDSFFYARRDLLVSLITKQRLPAIFYLREFAEAGGLMTYGNKLAELYRLVGLYVGRILKGEKPAELPVQESASFELVINLKTANALGLAVPDKLLATADEVIE